MYRKLIQIIMLVLLCSSVYAQPYGGNVPHNGRHELSSEPRIVIQNCEESLPKVMAQMIKYYIDLGDFDSADALLQIAKKYQTSDTVQAVRPPLSKQEGSHQISNTKQKIYGYF